MGTRDYSRPVRRTGQKSVVWLTTESAGALGAEPHRTHGILDWGGEYAGGEQTISRIHLTRGQGPQDEFSARDSLGTGTGQVETEYVAKQRRASQKPLSHILYLNLRLG